MQSQAAEVVFHCLFLYCLSHFCCLFFLKFKFQPHTSPSVCLLNSPSLMWCSAGSPVSHFSFPASPLSLCGSQGPVCFIINRPLCRHVLSSQHITLTCTGGILPQFYFFFFRLKTVQLMDWRKGGMSEGWVRMGGGWSMKVSWEREKRDRKRGMAEKDVGIC